MPFIYFRFCLLYSKLESVGHCLWGKQHPWLKSIPQKFIIGTLYCLAFMLEAQYKHPVHIIVFGVVTNDGIYMPPFIFPHGFRLNTEPETKSLEELVLAWIEKVAVKRSYAWQQNSVPYQHENPVFPVKNFLRPNHPLHFRLTCQIAIPLIIMCGAWLSETPTILSETLNMNWRQG